MNNEKLLKRLQAGTRNYNDANDLHAECYGTIGALELENERLKDFILESACSQGGTLRKSLHRQQQEAFDLIIKAES